MPHRQSTSESGRISTLGEYPRGAYLHPWRNAREVRSPLEAGGLPCESREKAAPVPVFSPERSAPGSMSVYSDLPSSSSADHLSVWAWCIQCKPPVCLGLDSLCLGSPLRCLCDHGCGCAAAYSKSSLPSSSLRGGGAACANDVCAVFGAAVFASAVDVALRRALSILRSEGVRPGSSSSESPSET